MLRRHKRLLIPAFLAAVTAFWWGCTQPEDIIVGKSTTVVHLMAERLPTTPPGMAYQLWAADTLISDELYGDSLYESVSMDEPFLYDFTTNTYHELDGTERADSNRFQFAGDILTYRWIFMTVQRADGSGPIPGPVMLMDTVMPVDQSELNLVFPRSDSLWYVAVEFNMETPSDGRDPGTDGAAVWFSTYDEETYTIQDTLAMTRWTIDTVRPAPVSFTDDEGDCVTSIVNIFNIRTDTVDVVYGFDTLQKQIVLFDVETFTECDSGQGNLFKTSVDLEWSTGPMRTGRYDDFKQVALPLPDLRRMGWWYRGWVVSSVIRDLNVGVGQMTPPAWVGLNKHDSLIRGIDGRLLSTGLFYDLFQPDDDNPYVDDPVRVPPYPGEDFFRNIPPAGADIEVNLVPPGGRSTGTVFISMHPYNALTDTTNFPLIVQTRDIPADTFSVQTDHQQFVMSNKTNVGTFGMGDRVGFPQVQARIQRF